MPFYRNLQLKKCYWEALLGAAKRGCTSIAFPLISAGIYGYPPKDAWHIALRTVQKFHKEFPTVSMDVTFAVISDDMFAMGQAVLNSLNQKQEFVFFWRENESMGYFSQWFPVGFVLEGIQYCHAEQYMMAKKALLAGDLESYVLIMHESDPAKCKFLGRNVRGLDAKQWDACKEQIVYNANMAKFSQNKKLRHILLATGSKTLAEASPRDTEWGIGLSAENIDSTNPEKWRGKNLLGCVLMKVRDELKKELF